MSSGQPFTDAAFASLVTDVLVTIVGKQRAALLSTHSWRVWLASSLRMAGASDARIQAFGRWLNPESIKIYARMTRQEYAHWVDKFMAVQHLDTARTTSLPVMDAQHALAAWGDQHSESRGDMAAQWQHVPPQLTAPPSPLRLNDRVSVYWTELNAWYNGTFRHSRVEPSDEGGTQRASCIVYDAVGDWATCTTKQLTYWHCLDDERWERIE
jgi:hypothetical protein